MKLSTWIEHTGPKKVAELCDVDPSTVSCWRRGKTTPRPHHIEKIFRHSRGRVSLREMLRAKRK